MTPQPPAYAAPAQETRLRPDILRADAERLLADADPVSVVSRLLDELRRGDRREQAIREGYEFSARLARQLHESDLYHQAKNLARTLRREIGRDVPANQRLTYEGGLRRAARIADGIAAWHGITGHVSEGASE